MGHRFMKDKALKTVVTLAYKAASSEVNSACRFWSYQPKEPEAVKKLRKF